MGQATKMAKVAEEIVEWEVTKKGFLAVNGDPPVRVKEIPAGAYTAFLGPGLNHLNIIKDNLLVLPNPSADRVLNSVRKFWASKSRYKNYGQLYKRGILLHGAPGTGKTVTITFLTQELVEAGGLVIYSAEPNIVGLLLQEVRKREKERPIIVIFEDLDIILENYGDHYLLKLLDGEYTVDNVVYLATTNNLTDISPRIRCRPSRFDEVIEIGEPISETREAYLKHLLSIDGTVSEHDLKNWVALSAGMSIAHMKELVLAVKILDNPLEESVTRLKELKATELIDDEE